MDVFNWAKHRGLVSHNSTWALDITEYVSYRDAFLITGIIDYPIKLIVKLDDLSTDPDGIFKEDLCVYILGEDLNFQYSSFYFKTEEDLILFKLKFL